MSVSRPLSFHFQSPVKRIHDGAGLQAFQQSIALRDLTIALTRIAKLVENKEVPVGVLSKEDIYTPDEIDKYDHDSKIPTTISTDAEHKLHQLDQIYTKRPIVKAIVDLLDKISLLIDEIPPLEGPRRYGNFACRKWHDQLESRIDNWMDEFLIRDYYQKENADGFRDEIKWYIVNAFGSRERLDYGTGHELNFLAFLTGLIKVDIIKFQENNDTSNGVNELDGYDYLVIFANYYQLSRKLITTYTLEPAGSHGVWGLDDHFHLIYILGSSQMLGHDNQDHHEIPPKYTQNRSIVYQYCTKNLYFNAISFIFKVKKGPFFEHSPILFDVSNVKNWEKIVKGMFKMFQAEVVGKFPVVQHFYFGFVLFPWLNANTLTPLPISANDDRVEIEEEDDDTTPTPTTIQRESENKDNFITAVPWKTRKPTESLQDRILNHSASSRDPIPNSSQSPNPTQIPTTRAPWAKR